MTKKNKSSNPKKLAIAGFFAIFIALLFMISSVPAQAGNQLISTLPITWTELPSQNLAYDYATITGYAYGTTTPLNERITLMNQTTFGNYVQTNTIGIINETPYHEQADYSIQNGQSFFASFPLNMTNVNMQKSTGISIGIIANTPIETSTLMHIMITGISITEYPLALGQTNMGGSHQATGYIGKAKLSTLDPSFAWKTITNNGYSVAVNQELQNITISQTSINNGIYTEEATYQGILKLPSEPDLSYTNSYISLQMNLTGKQFIVANLNGISYLSQIQTKTNGTFTFGTVNPNQQNAIILETKFTASQWNASTSAPSFFSVQGLEYYWWVGLIGLMSVIGLGAAASSHFSGEEENLKIPKGKFGR